MTTALQVSVRYFTVLREVTGKKEETLEFPIEQKVTIGLVLQALSSRYGKAFFEYVYDQKSGNVNGFLQLFINGQSTSGMKRLDNELLNGDVLAIVPPVGGG